MLILSCDTSSIASGALLRVPDDAGAPEATGPDLVGRAEVLGSFATEDTRSHAEATAPGPMPTRMSPSAVPGTPACSRSRRSPGAVASAWERVSSVAKEPSTSARPTRSGPVASGAPASSGTRSRAP
ncbi:hypothetical protein NS354_13055, partial [Leucobacter chromiiresistens]